MQSRKIFGAVIISVLVLTIFSVGIPSQTPTVEATIKIDPSLLEQMEEGDGLLKAIVKVEWNPDLEPIKYNHDAVIAELKAEAAETQAPVITYLSQKRDAKVLNTFWLTNIILVEAEEGTIRELATLTTVEKVLANFDLTVPANESPAPIEGFDESPVVWNIEKVRAPEVWDPEGELGLTGEGVRFATSDSGIELSHPDLADTLWTDDDTDPTYPGGWIEFDSIGQIVEGSVPHDTFGHGTATYGVIVGDAVDPDIGHVGMAPGAKGLGMHALNLPGGSGTFPQVVAGLQWIIDPVDQYGNPAGAPAQVSSHSWGADGYYTELIEPIMNMWYSGHFVCCSIGNCGEGCSGSPGNIYEAFGVGATDIDDYVADEATWSSSGEWVYKTDFPEPWPEDWNPPDQWLKPEVCAPGVDVIVPYPPDTYVYWGGTSFSSPHAAGAAILMLSGNPSLTVDEIQGALQETAVWYDRYYPERPDTRYGWGRIDAYEAVRMVALPQGIRGIVSDAETDEPLSLVEVYAHEANRTVYTDESGYYDMRLSPGTYTVTFSRWGYEEQTVTGVEVVEEVFTWLDKTLQPLPTGTVEGHVYFEPTDCGIPGATVKVVAPEIPVTVETTTDADGYYSLQLPEGTYSLEASAYGFQSDLEEGVTVSEGVVTTIDFYLTQPGKIAVIDYYGYGSAIVDFLTDEGYTVDAYDSIAAILPYITDYGCIVANNFGYIYSSDLTNLIDLTDANGIGVLWLDSWSSYCGAYWLNRYLGWPPYRYTSYGTTIDHLYYRVTQTDDDIIPGYTVGDKIIHDQIGYWKDHAYYRGVADGDIPGIGTVKTLTNVGYNYYGYDYDYSDSQGIIKVTRPDNKWVVLSMHGNTYYTSVANWHADTKEVFINAVNWATKPHVGIAKFVKFDLKVEPEETMWKYPTTVSVCIKNVGWIAGTHTVEMYVDGILEATEDVTLEPCTWTCLEWEISRFDVGTYTVRVQHLTTTFRVRPPRMTLKAYEFCTDQPLACADVYGCYRKYTGPGWYEQWSYTYGGYGHSQHAQPIGDIDEDGVNEIIVGGYEVLGNGRARILSYDAGLGTYIEEYNWQVSGGTYNSPSGSCVLDLDEDGDNEFVVSWTYSGADGIYAYDWDGSTLDTLDVYQGEGVDFAFDVYACDYDEDGDIEVLIANAPNMGDSTYNAHVTALGWDNTAGVFTEETWWYLSGYEGYMECPMVWSGDVDGDGHIEVVACISDSYYSTAGTWALNWDGTKWTEQLVYANPIGGGTHYGVAVGDVNGNGIDEIGIGNNNADYYANGAACLVEWDGMAYVNVWEGSWPEGSPVIEAVAIGDADNDGQNEFSAGGGDVHLISWTGTEYTEEATITETEGMLSGVVIGDCDTDGKNELKACDIITGPGKEWIFKYASEPSPIPGYNFEYFGHTDENGELVFDSPASVVDMVLFVYKPEFSEKGYQYLLEKDLLIYNDIEIIYEPHPETEAVIINEPEESSLEYFPHLGIKWLWKWEVPCPILWPFPTWFKVPTNIVVTPACYSFMHELYIVDAWGTWGYFMSDPLDEWACLAPDTVYETEFAGPISGWIKHTDNEDDTVTVTWEVTDSRGHDITGVSLDEVGLFAESTSLSMSYEPVNVDEYEAMLASIIEYKPLITLYDENNNIIKSGQVEWSDTTIITDDGTVAYATLRFKAGPYGDPAPEEIVWWIKESNGGKKK